MNSKRVNEKSPPSAGETESYPLWIIGYGNPQRRDDGLGPHVIALLDQALGDKPEVRTLTLHQLVPELVEDLKGAGSLILIDATIDDIQEGWQWQKVEPELKEWPSLSHRVPPGLLLGLLQSFYHQSTPTWLISIRGDDFDLGEGLSQEAEQRAVKVAEEIVTFIETGICPPGAC